RPSGAIRRSFLGRAVSSTWDRLRSRRNLYLQICRARARDGHGHVYGGERIEGCGSGRAGDRPCRRIDFHDLWRRRREVADAKPRRARTEVGETGPGLALDSVGELREVGLFEARELGPGGFVGHTLVLDCLALVPTDHERHAWLGAKVLRLPR